MTGDPGRVIAHQASQIEALKRELVGLENKMKWEAEQAGGLRLRWLAAKDQYEAHMAEPHYTPNHTPAIAPLANGGWGVFCEGCSWDAQDFIYPCQLPVEQRNEFPGQILVELDSVPVAPAADAARGPADAADREQAQPDDQQDQAQDQQQVDVQQVAEQEQDRTEDRHDPSVRTDATQGDER